MQYIEFAFNSPPNAAAGFSPYRSSRGQGCALHLSSDHHRRSPSEASLPGCSWGRSCGVYVRGCASCLWQCARVRRLFRGTVKGTPILCLSQFFLIVGGLMYVAIFRELPVFVCHISKNRLLVHDLALRRLQLWVGLDQFPPVKALGGSRTLPARGP